MKRKCFLTIICLFILVLTSCGTPTQSTPAKTPTANEPTVKKVQVIEYQESIILGEEYNEESVKVEAVFSDDSSKIYSGDELSFNYVDFDIYTLGRQTIKIRVKELNVTETISVEVIKKSIKILMIANSFGDDTVQWVHEIGDDLGYDFTIANLYIGGCVLSTHLSNLKTNSAAYEYVSYNKTTKVWSRTPKTTIEAALGMDDWDYVSLQQGSYDSGRAESYNTIDEIMDRVLAIKDDVEFIWNMTWAYQQDSGHANFGIYNHDQMTMYNGIINAVQTKVVPNERFKFIVPNGTAVQNARTSFIGDNLCRDVYCHLTLDFGRYIAGLTMVATVTGADISEINYSPNLSVGHRAIAIEAVKFALLNPFNITESSYTNEW